MMQTPELSKELLARLDALGAKLGVAGTEIWRILVQQAQIEAIYDGIGLVVGLIFAGLCCRSVKWLIRECDKPGKYDNVEAGIWAVVGSGVLALLLIGTGLDVFGKLLNPEYWALQQILEVLK
jgi:hypothetical protein